MSESYPIEELQKIIGPIAKKYGLARVWLFGSFARGDFNATSDLDLLIDKGQLTGLFALSRFCMEVSESLGMKVDVLTIGNLDAAFLQQIRQEEVLLYAS